MNAASNPVEGAITASRGKRVSTGRVCLSVAGFFLLLSGFIASPTRDLWPFLLIPVLFSLAGLILASSKIQRATGVLLFLVSGALCLHSLWLDRQPRHSRVQRSEPVKEKVSP